MDLVYSTTVLTQGGRGGQMQSEDGSFKLKMVVPPEMGGAKDAAPGPNPEMLFAGAFAACFDHSVRHVARASKVPLKGCYVEAKLSMYVNFEGAYRMALTMTVYMAGAIDQLTADDLLQRAKGICPYIDATKTNITVNLSAVVDNPA
jgi:osmotically inducible protein OsmC